jgi:hypothetical protein
MQVKRPFAALFVLGFAGCAGRARPVEFQGHPAERVVAPEGVLETSVVPRDAERLGRLFVRCRLVTATESFSERRLLDVDCSEARLRRLLREAAAEQGGDVLAESSCQQSSSAVSCRAVLARQSAPLSPRPALPAARAADVRGELGAWVFVNYEAARVRHVAPPVLAEENVGDVAVRSPAHVTVGTLETRCDECSELSARDALRIAAGRLGASDVVGVRCVSEGSEQRCLGEAAVWENAATP